MKLYAKISKVEDQDDGTIKVYGYASSGAEDSDGEVVTPEAMKAAIPDYMKFGAVREMHQSIAAGTAIEASVDEDGKTNFGAHIVDPVAVKKVKSSVYKGFSIGGKVTQRDDKNKKLITGLRLVEVSLVDRPANPEAVFTMYKADTDVDQKAAVKELGTLVDAKAITPAELLKAARERINVDTFRKTLKPGKLRKGMYGLSQFAQLLAQVGYMTQDSANEEAWEGDKSTMPMKLRDWLATGVMLFEDMTTEETSELLASLKTQISGDATMTTAAAQADTTKAGATFSQKTKDSLADCHKAMTDVHDNLKACAKGMKDCCDKLAGLGWQEDKKDDDDASMAAKPGDVAKTAAAAAVTDKTGLEEFTVLAKSLTESLGGITKELGSLSKRLKTIEDQPAPAKGVTKAIAVDKTQDGGGDAAPGMKPIFKSDGTVDEAATLMKVIHRTGGAPLNPPQRNP